MPYFLVWSLCIYYPGLVSCPFYAIPIYRFKIFHLLVIIITTMVSPISSISHIEGKNISWSVCSVLVSPSPGWYYAPLHCVPKRTSSSCSNPPCQSGPCQERKPLFLHNIIIVICCYSCTCTHGFVHYFTCGNVQYKHITPLLKAQFFPLHVIYTYQ